MMNYFRMKGLGVETYSNLESVFELQAGFLKFLFSYTLFAPAIIKKYFHSTLPGA